MKVTLEILSEDPTSKGHSGETVLVSAGVFFRPPTWNTIKHHAGEDTSLVGLSIGDSRAILCEVEEVIDGVTHYKASMQISFSFQFAVQLSLQMGCDHNAVDGSKNEAVFVVVSAKSAYPSVSLEGTDFGVQGNDIDVPTKIDNEDSFGNEDSSGDFETRCVARASDIVLTDFVEGCNLHHADEVACTSHKNCLYVRIVTPDWQRKRDRFLEDAGLAEDTIPDVFDFQVMTKRSRKYTLKQLQRIPKSSFSPKAMQRIC